jgi:hypothetical protein
MASSKAAKQITCSPAPNRFSARLFRAGLEDSAVGWQHLALPPETAGMHSCSGSSGQPGAEPGSAQTLLAPPQPMWLRPRLPFSVAYRPLARQQQLLSDRLLLLLRCRTGGPARALPSPSALTAPAPATGLAALPMPAELRQWWPLPTASGGAAPATAGTFNPNNQFFPGMAWALITPDRASIRLPSLTERLCRSPQQPAPRPQPAHVRW